MKSVLSRSLLPAAALLLIAAVSGLLLLKSGGHIKKTTGVPAPSHRPTVIVDAGHGGADGGAVSISGVKESTVNLDIACRLDQLLGFFGTHVAMTRTTEDLDYSEGSDTIREKKVEDQRRRLALINSTEHAVLLSIHQNTYPSGGPYGAQVLYAPTAGSKEFAERVQLLLVGALNNQNRRAAAQVPDSLLLMNHIKCPALLIECGFLSNPTEEKLLMTGDYRLKIAAVIAAGYLQHREAFMQTGT